MSFWYKAPWLWLFGFKNINLFNNSSFIPSALLNIKQVKVKHLKTKYSSSLSGRVCGWEAPVSPPGSISDAVVSSHC